MTAPIILTGGNNLTCVAAHALIACIALAAGSAVAQAPRTHEPTIAVTGVGRLFVAPTQAVVSLGATVERQEARDAQRELDAVMRETVSSIRELGIAAGNIQTSGLSLMPVYSERGDLRASETGGASAQRDEPRIVAYRATNLVEVTIEDLSMVGAVVDAGVAAGVNEIRNISFGLEDDLPYRVTALERAVEAAVRKARAAASALGMRLAEPIEVSERSVDLPRRGFEAAFAGPAASIPIEPGELAIEAIVDVTFGIDGDTAPAARD
jgi:uncharacterized protein YggE